MGQFVRDASKVCASTFAKAMAESLFQRVLVFGDECVDKLAAVKEIYDLSGSNPVLRSFLQQAVTTIQSEVFDLRPEERSYFASYGDILDLAEGYAAQKPLPPIVGDVLLFVVQIGLLILRAEQDPSIFAQDNDQSIHILGLCVGLPAACIASVARNILHAVEIALATLGVVIRFSAALHRRSQLVEECSGAWASTIVSSQQDVERLLEKINQSLPANAFKDLLALALKDISEKPLLLDRTIRALSASLHDNERVLLTPIGPTVHTALIKRILENGNGTVEVLTAEEANDQFEHASQDRIAIVSMSGRFPGAENIEDFWRLLLGGETTDSPIPSSRFTTDDPVLKKLSGCFLSNPGLFDNEFFKMSPSEAMQVDPIQRMLLMVVYEALQMAGFVPNLSPSTQSDRIATFIGQTTSDWLGINDQQGVGTHYVPGSLRAFAAGRLNHFFGWGGGYSSIDTVTGGGAIHLLPEMFEGLNNGGFLSASHGCKSFRDDADGYCRGEAVAAVVLKRLEDAQREGDPILAVIRGSARNSNAGSSRSIAAPGGKAQQRLFQQILREARVHPNEVNAVEMHAPGTQAGDTAEMESVIQVFAANGRTAENPLYTTSVKANIGHGEAAAGIVSLIKAVLMLRKETISPQPGQHMPLNEAFGSSLTARYVTIPDDAVPWPTKDRQRKILVNSFDAAGGNVSALLEGFPNAEKNYNALADRRTHHVVVVSARSAKALAFNKARLRDALLANAYVLIADVAYTLTARRVHEPAWRQSYVVETVDDLVAALIADSGSSRSTLNKPQRYSVVFAFTGQGASYGGMGGELYRTNSTVRNLLDSYQAICHAEKLGSFISYLLDEDGSPEATETTRQTALVALEIALAQYFQILGIRPTVVVGHSLGEYAALCIAGVLSVTDTLRLVHQRAQLVERLLKPGNHGMLATGLSRSQVEELLAASDGACEVACINSPTSTVIGGPKASLEDLQTICNNQGITSKLLPVQYAYHTAQMEVVLDTFHYYAERAQFHPPRISVVSPSCEGTPDKFDADYLCHHLRKTVDFLGAIRSCENEQLITSNSMVFEIGSHPICNNLISQSLDLARPTFASSLQREMPQWCTVSNCLAQSYEAGLDIDWRAFHKPFVANLKLVDLPMVGTSKTSGCHVVAEKARISRAVRPEVKTVSPAAYTTFIQEKKTMKDDQPLSSKRILQKSKSSE
ncbi:hypothetical protein PRZ48_010685 [Zasmidium cellare]|uniref:Ketosynthase family 3 (KS3) domain-containing protein n=1 Tax=Zasmidium cellare TaxID=395010 RepID=A0ABR0E9N9_ZASCE|nr:hypothetical protein PRZ48_010685 [Zasmidium cellare]